MASSDLVNMGIGVVSYTLKDVHDDQVILCTSHPNKSLGLVVFFLNVFEKSYAQGYIFVGSEMQ